MLGFNINGKLDCIQPAYIKYYPLVEKGYMLKRPLENDDVISILSTPTENGLIVKLFLEKELWCYVFEKLTHILTFPKATWSLVWKELRLILVYGSSSNIIVDEK